MGIDDFESGETGSAPPGTSGTSEDESGTGSVDGSTGGDTADGTVGDETMGLDGSTGAMTGDESGEPPPDTGGETTTGDDEDGGSEETGEQTTCEQWADAWLSCYPGYYTSAYLEQLCGYYSDNDVCPEEAVALIECEAAGGVCNSSCDSKQAALAACELAAEAEELGCYDLPVLESAGTMQSQCEALSQQAFDCDAEGTYISGFSQYTGYANALDYMTDHCMNGAYWTFLWFGVPSDSCGAAYEDMLACVQALDCDSLDEAMFGFSSSAPCAEELVAVECKCELEIN